MIVSARKGHSNNAVFLYSLSMLYLIFIGCSDSTDAPIQSAADIGLDTTYKNTGDGPHGDQKPYISDLGIKAKKCSSSATCKSGNCIDGYCCDNVCGGTCTACNVPEKEGICSYIPLGTDPDKECPGIAICGNNACNGYGSCTKASTGRICKNQCSSTDKSTLEQHTCDSKGNCQFVPKQVKCKPYICDSGGTGGTPSCTTTCMDNSTCANNSVCDRIDAHKTGSGVCIPPAKVEKVKTAAGLVTAVKAITDGTSSKTHVRLAVGNYSLGDWIGGISGHTDGLTINKGKVTLIGEGMSKTVIKNYNKTFPSDSLIQVHDASLRLQGMSIESSNWTGVECLPYTSGQSQSLTLTEVSFVGNKNWGALSFGCDLTVRRSKFNSNGGGVAIAKGYSFNPRQGRLTLVNNLFVANGNVNFIKGVGGLYIESPAKGSLVLNNTFVDNISNTPTKRAAQCINSSAPLYNSIVWDTKLPSTTVLTTGCTFEHSIVSGNLSGTGNLSKNPLLDSKHIPKPNSPCIDQGQDKVMNTVLDHRGNPRPAAKGGKVDIGAHEVK